MKLAEKFSTQETAKRFGSILSKSIVKIDL